ncbi:restriction endonuclease subunit S [Rossellomorea sp. LJF3]|uniref:restriction endonuclease subunit S n=1 Tax=Rossellomorea sp. LJF3 TaxID=3126099 RepID=UPI00300CB7CB
MNWSNTSESWGCNILNIPKIRFKEFTSKWKIKELKEVVEIQGGGTPSTSNSEYWNGNIQWFTPSEIGDKKYVSESIRTISSLGLRKSSAKLLPIGTILLTTRASLGDMSINTQEVSTNQGFQSLICKENVYNQFIYYQQPIIKQHCYTHSSGSTFLEISKHNLGKCKIGITTIKEQKKISDFLSLIDENIYKLREKINLLRAQKKGYLQKIFSRELRFMDDNGQAFPDWQTQKLSNYLFEHKIRNYDNFYSKEDVLSVSGEYGIVNQIEFQGRSFAGKSVANYHVVHTGDVVYTKSPLKSNPYGIIKCNKHETGIVSTLYAVYSCKETMIGEFLDYYFELDDHTNSYLRPLVNKGAKNDMKINNENVLKGVITAPIIDEQRKIIKFLKALDNNIKLQEEKYDNLLKQKKYFVQHMFI